MQSNHATTAPTLSHLTKCTTPKEPCGIGGWSSFGSQKYIPKESKGGVCTLLPYGTMCFPWLHNVVELGALANTQSLFHRLHSTVLCGTALSSLSLWCRTASTAELI